LHLFSSINPLDLSSQEHRQNPRRKAKATIKDIKGVRRLKQTANFDGSNVGHRDYADR